MSTPIVAIVGRPNVGKSTLFNKLIGERLSIVDDTPGVTRDRIYGECEWNNRKIRIIDTGGIEPYSDDVILKQMRRQAELAIDTADVTVLVTDVRDGVVATDEEVAQMLQKSGKPVVLCVNKCDQIGEPPAQFYEFYNLGLGEPIQVSSVHGTGTGDLLEEVCKFLPPEDEAELDEDVISVAVIGKPNVGKSSLINYITGENRCIVSDIAGTTRDSIDTIVENEYGKFNFIDTAGMRRKARIYDNTEQDSKVAGMALEAGKGCIIAVNKWDAIDKDTHTMGDFRKTLDREFAFMSYTPYIFISAKTGQRVNNLFELITTVANNNAMRIRTGMLNDLLNVATTRVQPPTDKGKRLKIYYCTQASTKPPTFVFFCNNKELFHFSYQRYLENRIRESFGLEGTPIRIIVRERGEKY